MSNTTDLLGIIDSPLLNLPNVMRFSDSFMHKREHVSDHVSNMIGLALVYYYDKNFSFKDYIDIKEVIFRISIHDLDEAASLDIPRPFKYFNNEILEQINQVSLELLKAKNIPKELINKVVSAKDFTNEGFFVRLLDTIQPGLIMIREHKLGNNILIKDLINPANALEYFIELTDNLDNRDYADNLIKLALFYKEKFTIYYENITDNSSSS